MADHRKKTASILLAVESNGRLKPLSSLELFPSLLWDREEAGAGTFRVRDNGKWISLTGEKYCFLTPAHVGELLANRLRGEKGKIAIEPKIPIKSIIRVPIHFDEDGNPEFYTQALTVTPPHQGPDMCWYVWGTDGEELKQYPCEGIEIRRRP